VVRKPGMIASEAAGVAAPIRVRSARLYLRPPSQRLGLKTKQYVAWPNAVAPGITAGNGATWREPIGTPAYEQRPTLLLGELRV
jgi:hypothetical protein